MTWLTCLLGVIVVAILIMVGGTVFVWIALTAMDTDPIAGPLLLMAWGCLLLAWLLFRTINPPPPRKRQ